MARESALRNAEFRAGRPNPGSPKAPPVGGDQDLLILRKLFQDIILPEYRGQKPRRPPSPEECAWMVRAPKGESNILKLIRLREAMDRIRVPKGVPKVERPLWGPQLAAFSGRTASNEVIRFHPKAETRKLSSGESRASGDWRALQAAQASGFQTTESDPILDQVMAIWCSFNESRIR